MNILLLVSISYSVSVDCENVKALGIGLGIHTHQTTIWTDLQSDCCIAGGIDCDVNKRVIRITWELLELNGSINASAIPPMLTTLDLSSNLITGSIPSSLPNSLIYLYAHINQLSGNIPSVLPSSLIALHLHDNLLNGPIPTKLPSELTGLYLNNNQLVGSIPSLLPSELKRMHVEYNLLNGDLPRFPDTLFNLYLNDQSSPTNHFSGVLRLNRPTTIVAAGNYITDVFIQDFSALTFCDLSNNPLLGNTNIVNLTMCTMTGLYNASSLPNTAIVTRTSSTRNSLSKATQTTSGHDRNRVDAYWVALLVIFFGL